MKPAFPARLGIENDLSFSARPQVNIGHHELNHLSNQPNQHASYFPAYDKRLEQSSEDYNLHTEANMQYKDHSSNCEVMYLDHVMSAELHDQAASLLQPWNANECEMHYPFTVSDSIENTTHPTISTEENNVSPFSHGDQQHSLGSNGEDDASLMAQSGTPYGTWQDGVPMDQIESLFRRVAGYWPKRMRPNSQRKSYRNLALILAKHAYLRELFLSGDIAAIKLLARKTAPTRQSDKVNAPLKLRSNKPRAQESWFLGHLTRVDFDKIISNLMVYWQLKESAVMSRLRFYAQTNGLITSPEPLLSNDIDQFREAAEAIFSKDSNKRQKIIGPVFQGTNDVLHQPSVTFENDSGGPFFLDYENWGCVPNAERYRSHEWLKRFHFTSIRAIHSAIVRQWVPWIDHQFVSRHLKEVNRFLEDNQSYIRKILDGDEDAAYIVANAAIESPDMMRKNNKDFKEMMEKQNVIVHL